jgi:hypothetical protein
MSRCNLIGLRGGLRISLHDGLRGGLRPGPSIPTDATQTIFQAWHELPPQALLPTGYCLLSGARRIKRPRITPITRIRSPILYCLLATGYFLCLGSPICSKKSTARKPGNVGNVGNVTRFPRVFRCLSLESNIANDCQRGNVTSRLFRLGKLGNQDSNLDAAIPRRIGVSLHPGLMNRTS